ncbi:hypothetical protein [Mycobacterium colombiense]|uniref:hypothetical protein n=1 Tax=Mycobacterium colombiense TaxID=339268 RepID=UPI001402AA8E|nr:hypothetical protein [Mycobacterium colombiense]
MGGLGVTVTNLNRWGKKMNKWKVVIGKRTRYFTQEEWEKDGLAWVNSAHQQGG